MTMCLSVNSYDHGFLSGLPAKSADTKRQHDKFVIFIFSDGLKTQYTNAKPILDKYGFKGTFDVICNYVGKKEGYMNWKEIKTLNKEGHEIGSHSMNHVHLKQLSKKSIEYEVGNSKKCLNAHGIKVTSFEYPFSEGSDDKTIVSIVAKYYDFATRGNDPLMFLRCDDMMKYGQKDCKRYQEDRRANCKCYIKCYYSSTSANCKCYIKCYYSSTSANCKCYIKCYYSSTSARRKSNS